MCILRSSLLWLFLPAAAAMAGDTKLAAPSSEAAIRATAQAFVAAFDRGDAKAVAALFTEKATIIDDRGEPIKGRKAIEAEYASLFKLYPGAKMEVSVKSVEFPSPAMAVEDGVATVVAKTAIPPSAAKYTAIHVQENGKWLMASVHETRIQPASNFARLEDLGWLIGTWENKSPAGTVRTTYQWIANMSFIERHYTVRRDGAATSSGVQIIGWDPQAGRIKSWSFDASGGHGEGYWAATPDGYQIDMKGTLADGTPISSRDFLIRVAGEDRVLGWRSVNRQVAEMRMPDSGEVVLDRVPEKR